MLSSGAAKPSTAGVKVDSNPRACARNSCHHSGSISVSDSATGGCDASDACSREPSATANGTAISIVITVTATISEWRAQHGRDACDERTKRGDAAGFAHISAV